NEPMSFSPGEKFEYSNSNYILLSYVAELATRSSFEDLLKKYIFHPLNMRHTGLDKNDRQSKLKALGYQASPGNEYAPARFNDMSIMMGAGSMYSTARDLYAFDRALNGDKFLSAKSKQQMYAVFKNNYALGWEVDTVNGRIQVSHSGSIDGFLSNVIRYPGEDVCIIFLSNYFQSRGPQISKALVSIAFNENFSLPKKREFVQLSIGDLQPYEGVYQMEKGPSLKVFIEDGKIKGQLEGQSPFLMLVESKDQFYIKAIDTDVLWVKNEKQEVVEMVLKQGRKEMRFAREMKIKK
ncbi:MAG TPA: serine hydrolase domain-containing protein, partial [Flavisolibacter sp.]